MSPSTWQYLRRIAVECGLALLGSWWTATVIHRIQHAYWERYLLVPINQTSLYFYPLAFTSCAWTAWRHRRGNLLLVAAAAFAWAWQAARAAYWAWAARQVGAGVDDAALNRFRSEHFPESIPVGIAAFAAIILFVMGMRRALDEPASTAENNR